MIDVEKVKKACEDDDWICDKLAYWSGHDISELNEKYNYNQNKGIIGEALTELDRLQKKEQEGQMIEKIFGFDINDIRLICALINQRFMSKDNFHEELRNFQKAYQKGYDDCYEMMNKALNEHFKNFYGR